MIQLQLSAIIVISVGSGNIVRGSRVKKANSFPKNLKKRNETDLQVQMWSGSIGGSDRQGSTGHCDCKMICFRFPERAIGDW
jgi:hypothetical protein